MNPPARSGPATLRALRRGRGSSPSKERWLSPGRLANIGGAKDIEIEVFCRQQQRTIDETVCGEGLIRLFYGTPAGFKMTSKLFAYRWLSFFGGLYYDTPLSKKKISSFAQELSIDLDECEKEIGEYQTFNEFFARKLKPGSREVDSDPAAWVSPGDGRLLVFPAIDDDTISYVKWAPIRLMDLFNSDPELVERYRGGACGVLRLCPSDYHRFHFPASGMVGPTTVVPGLLHSVNPYVLEQATMPVFALNKRTLCSLQTKSFGEVLLMEVGAMGVGSIVQTSGANRRVEAGEEKGYFKFGGSTTIFFLEPGRIAFADDLIANSHAGLETLVRMGESLGRPIAAAR